MHSNHKILARCEVQCGDVGLWYSVSCSLVDCSERLGRIFELLCVEMEIAGLSGTLMCFCHTTGRRHISEECHLEECLFVAIC